MQHFHSIIFRIWNSSVGNPSPPLALFTAMLPKTHLTSHSRMSGSRWVIIPSWLSGAWRSFCSVTFYCTPKWTHHTYTYIPPFRTSINSVLITVPCAMHCALPFCDQVQISGRQFFYQPGKGVCFRMIQVHDIYCTFVYLLLYYYISSTWFYIRSSGIRSRMLGTLPYCISSLVIYFIYPL